MSGASSSAAEWFTRLEPVVPPATARRPDDPRLGEVAEFWQSGPIALTPGRAVLVGFPQDEGVRRNHGRPGAAEAPAEIRRHLYRLTPWNGDRGVDLTALPPLDVGNVRIAGSLEETQEALGVVVGAILTGGAIPIVLGGGHETAYGHYLGYVTARQPVGILNLDAHLDVRPCLDGQGHSGSPFRQALEHPTAPLPGAQYVCLGAQPQSVSRAHWQFARERGCRIGWYRQVQRRLIKHLRRECGRLSAAGCQVYVSLDADAVRSADMPGVSAPNPNGFPAEQILACARAAGNSPVVASFDLVEINPRHDPDGRSARWAALAVWSFLMGLASRPSP
jgi:formiminoglutamase